MDAENIKSSYDAIKKISGFDNPKPVVRATASRRKHSAIIDADAIGEGGRLTPETSDHYVSIGMFSEGGAGAARELAEEMIRYAEMCKTPDGLLCELAGVTESLQGGLSSPLTSLETFERMIDPKAKIIISLMILTRLAYVYS